MATITRVFCNCFSASEDGPQCYCSNAIAGPSLKFWRDLAAESSRSVDRLCGSSASSHTSDRPPQLSATAGPAGGVPRLGAA